MGTATICLLSALTMATEPSVNKILTRVRATYQKAGNLEADFTQVHTDQLRQKKRTEKGKLWAKPDGRVRWSYFEPVRKDFVYDGEAAYFYEPENAQVTVFEQFQDSPLWGALRFLWGQGDLRKVFDAKSCAKDCDGFGRNLVLELWPKASIPTVDHSILVIDPKTSRVVQSIVVDPLGNQTAYLFADVRFGNPVADAKFEFRVPKGVSILRSTVGTDAP